MSERFEELKQRQTSGLMSWLGRQPFDLKLTVAWSGVVAGIVSGAIAFTGTQDAKVNFCLQRYETKLCKPTYTMPLHIWEHRRPTHSVLAQTILPTNPLKPIWALTGALAFSFAGVIFRQLQDDERQLQDYTAIQERKELTLAEIAVNAEIEALTVEHVTVIQQAELLADTEVKALAIEQEEELFRYQVAGMTPEEIADFVKGQETPYLTGLSLDQVNDPSDKVKASADDLTPISPSTSFPENLISTYPWLNEFISNTSLILGSQGSGKSWIVRLLALLKKRKGYKVIVFDPNSNRGEWQGVDFYGSYEEIEAQMDVYVTEIRKRYDEFRESTLTEEAWRKKLWDEGKALAIICEEYSTYNDFIENEKLIKSFVKTASTLSRKQEAPVTFVSHNLTKECLGNVAGLFNIFERMQRLRLNTKTSSTSSQPVSAGTGTVKAVDSDELREITTPQLTEKIRDFRGEIDRLNDTRSFLEKQFTHPELNEETQPSDVKDLKLTDKHNAILNYLKANGARTLKQIADSRRLGLPEARELIKDLVARELVELDGDVYRLTTT